MLQELIYRSKLYAQQRNPQKSQVVQFQEEVKILDKIKLKIIINQFIYKIAAVAAVVMQTFKLRKKNIIP